MENVWFFTDNEFMVSWDAILSPHSRPEELLAWTQEVVRIGAATRVLVPVAIPRYQAFGTDTTDKLIRGLADRYRAGTIDLLDFASFGNRHEGNLLHTRIAVADRDGTPREFLAARATDLPPLTWRHAGGTSDLDDEGMFFLDVSPCGPMTAERLAEFAARSAEISISFGLYTNIWFPWIVSPDPETNGFDYDNRPLASVHTPGLNAFLTQVKGMTESMGGRWKVEALACQSMVLESGIDLAWLPPASASQQLIGLSKLGSPHIEEGSR